MFSTFLGGSEGVWFFDFRGVLGDFEFLVLGNVVVYEVGF